MKRKGRKEREGEKERMEERKSAASLDLKE
jgi:hypothetical protein